MSIPQITWQAIDSAQTWSMKSRNDGWREARDGQCIALRSDGDRCGGLTAEGVPFCGRHHGNLTDFYSDAAAEVAMAKAKRDEPNLFRFTINRARELDAQRVLEDAGAVVYFFAVDDIVKIGFSINAAARVASLRTNKTLTPEGYDTKSGALLGTTPGGRNLERRLHGLLGDHRICGEWFTRSPEVNEVIAHCLEGKPAPLMEDALRELYAEPLPHRKPARAG